MSLLNELEQAKQHYKRSKTVLGKLSKANRREMDQRIHTWHEEVFDDLDCLDCANCCKTTSPIFRDVDIRRLSRALRVSELGFIEEYLRLDEEGDYVLKSSPCSFLGPDNKCFVYENRPLACREYPHTDRKNMYQIKGLTHRNTLVCPAVWRITEKLRLATEKNS
ncbi:MAG: YkgJ family cysteine cluster protein [Bacteroidetes bacterium]|nr:MAG: YkgJ family cysteine cluster protein [Bacteroidota bacterium]